MNKYFILTISFISGLSIMAMEITASRILAPYFGTSIFVWTNIIGVVMFALSLGYFFGGKLADKKPDLNFLLKLILASGIIFIFIPLVVKPIATLVTAEALAFESGSTIIFVSSFVVTLLLYAVPIGILGMTSPFMIKIYSLENRNIGEVAGSIFAVSTLGSLIGTFIPTLWFIPTFGTKFTIFTFSSLLIFLGIAGITISKIKYLFIILPFIFFFVLQPPPNFISKHSLRRRVCLSIHSSN